jgi:D-hydroxyproline dehydrogenase subunit gamma
LRFRKLDTAPRESPLTFRFNGKAVTAERGLTLAAALLAAGHIEFRKSVASEAMHGPYCLMGACFECTVEIAGEGRRQACMTEVREGMDVSSP